MSEGGGSCKITRISAVAADAGMGSRTARPGSTAGPHMGHISHCQTKQQQARHAGLECRDAWRGSHSEKVVRVGGMVGVASQRRGYGLWRRGASPIGNPADVSPKGSGGEWRRWPRGWTCPIVATSGSLGTGRGGPPQALLARLIVVLSGGMSDELLTTGLTLEFKCLLPHTLWTE